MNESFVVVFILKLVIQELRGEDEGVFKCSNR